MERDAWEEWDVCRSLFDNHVCKDMDANLTYMYKHFGFYLPDAEYLTNPEGLLKYLVSTQGDERNNHERRHNIETHVVHCVSYLGGF